MILARVVSSRESASRSQRSSRGQLERSKHQQEFYKKEGLQQNEQEAEEHSYKNDNRFVWKRYPLKDNRQNKLDEL